MTAELHWFPFFMEKWLASAAISMMLPEQEGAYIRLLALSWGDGSSEPKLPDDAATLARMSRLGSRWKKLGALVRDQFEARDGFLYNAMLCAVWTEAQTKHSSAVERGKKGGATRAANRQQNASSASSSANSQLLAGSQATTDTVPVSEPNGSERQGTAADAPAPEGARTPPRTGDYLDRPSVRDELLRRGVRVPEGRTAGAPPLQDDELYAEYMARLAERATTWLEKHGEEREGLEQEARETLQFPRGELTPARKRVLEQQVYELVRERAGWPTYETFREGRAA